MKRVAPVAFLLVGAAVASSALVASQQVPTPNVPGMPTVGRFVIVNPPAEPVPVVVAAGGEMQPVTIVGTPSVSLSPGSAVVTRSGPQRWEYRTEEVEAAALNAAGLEGWEAVGVIAEPGGTSRVLLKRPQ